MEPREQLAAEGVVRRQGDVAESGASGAADRLLHRLYRICPQPALETMRRLARLQRVVGGALLVVDKADPHLEGALRRPAILLVEGFALLGIHMVHKGPPPPASTPKILARHGAAS